MTGYKNPGYKITVSVLSWSFLRNTRSHKMGKHAAILILCCNSKCQFQLSIQYLKKENTWFFVFLLLKTAWFLLDKKMLQRWFSLSKSNYYDENNTGWLIIPKDPQDMLKEFEGRDRHLAQVEKYLFNTGQQNSEVTAWQVIKSCCEQTLLQIGERKLYITWLIACKVSNTWQWNQIKMIGTWCDSQWSVITSPLKVSPCDNQEGEGRVSRDVWDQLFCHSPSIDLFLV